MNFVIAQSHLRTVALVAALILPASGFAQAASSAFPPSSIDSAQKAEQALAALESERAGALTRFAQEEQACYARFFVNRCLDKVREQRRQALAPLADLELEARRYLRLERAQERERDAQQRRAASAQRGEREADEAQEQRRADRGERESR